MKKTKKELGSNIRHKTSLSLNSAPIVHSKAFENKANLNFVYKSSDYDEDKTYRFIGTSEVKDRDGEIVLLSGWDFSNYKNNPIVLWGHDGRSLPIGKTTAILKDEVNKCIYFDVEFSESYDFAKQVKSLVEEGIVRATSLGFRVTDWDWDDKTDALLLTECELFELSIVTIPANQDALLQEGKSVDDVNTKSVSEDLINVVSQLQVSIQEMQSQLSSALAQSSVSNPSDNGSGEPEPTGGEIPKTEENNNIEQNEDLDASKNDDPKPNATIDEASVALIVEAVLAKLNPKADEPKVDEPKVDEPKGDEGNEDENGDGKSDPQPNEESLAIVSIEDLDETNSFVIVTEEEN